MVSICAIIIFALFVFAMVAFGVARGFIDAIFVKFGKYCFSDARSGCVYTDNDVDERSVIRCD